MAKKDAELKDMEIVRGSGNVFRDFGRPNADLEQARSKRSHASGSNSNSLVGVFLP